MEPDLELVQISPGESFAAWSHGYPFRTVRWHFPVQAAIAAISGLDPMSEILSQDR